jgi:site-specific DNA-methyltransferase (adenine-specific)
VGKAIDKAAPAEAAKWDGFGTALKPAFEPIVMGRKPFAGTVVANVLTHGTGALNVGACRIGTETTTVNRYRENHGPFGDSQAGNEYASRESVGRWPANVILDEHAAANVDEQSGQVPGQVGAVGRGNAASFRPGETGKTGSFIDTTNAVKDTGGASRFFYNAKAPKRERPVVDGVAHATVKPLSVMRWLIRLVTPPGGTVLEPFAGSGTTVEAAMMEGFSCIAIEKDETYLPLIQARIDRSNDTLDLL